MQSIGTRPSSVIEKRDRFAVGADENESNEIGALLILTSSPAKLGQTFPVSDPVQKGRLPERDDGADRHAAVNAEHHEFRLLAPPTIAAFKVAAAMIGVRRCCSVVASFCRYSLGVAYSSPRPRESRLIRPSARRQLLWPAH